MEKEKRSSEQKRDEVRKWGRTWGHWGEMSNSIFPSIHLVRCTVRLAVPSIGGTIMQVLGSEQRKRARLLAGLLKLALKSLTCFTSNINLNVRTVLMHGYGVKWNEIHFSVVVVKLYKTSPSCWYIYTPYYLHFSTVNYMEIGLCGFSCWLLTTLKPCICFLLITVRWQWQDESSNLTLAHSEPQICTLIMRKKCLSMLR